MGSVYRAVDEALGMDVAVKENLFTSDEYTRQFRLEAVILANLRHPNLPRVTDHFVIGDQGQYLIMDYIEGEDLRLRMERTSFVSEEEAVLIGVAMCDALQYLHTRKPAVIHRDVKPGNVRITPDGHIYLVDFGLAKLVKGSQATTTGARAMTPGYSPPEQYGTARTDPRTDIYSLGATLYAALTGIIPEDGLARAMDNVELTPIRKHNPKISRKLANAIEKAMAVRPDDRFQSAEDFKRALATSNIKTQRLQGEIVVEPPPQVDADDTNDHLAREVPPDQGPPLPPSKPLPSQPLGKPRRGVGLWILFSFFLLAVLAFVLALVTNKLPISKGFLALISTPSLDPATLVMAMNLETNTPLPTWTTTATPLPSDTSTPTKTSVPTLSVPSITPTFTQTVAPTATLLGGGYSQIAFASTRSGLPQVYVVDSAGQDVQQLTHMPDGACQPDWSPDGLHLVFISPCTDRLNDYPDAKLFIINIDGTGLSPLPLTENGGFDPAWSPDGTRIAFASSQGGFSQIYSINLKDYVITPLTQNTGDVNLPDWSRQPAWSPDGKLIAYTGHSLQTDTPQIWVMEQMGQDQTRLVNRGTSYWDFLPSWSPDGQTIIFSETSGAQALGWLMVFDYAHLQTATVVHLRSGSYGSDASYSPDGTWLAYESVNTNSAESTNFQIFILKNATGNGPLQLPGAFSGAEEFDPVWRPAGAP